MDISRDILPLTDFKRHTTEYVERLRSDGRPLVLTINGKPAMVVLTAVQYQRLRDRLAELESTGPEPEL